MVDIEVISHSKSPTQLNGINDEVVHPQHFRDDEGSG